MKKNKKISIFPKLKNNKIYIGTPMYGGASQANYVISLSELCYNLGLNGIDYKYVVAWNDALITRARNKIVQEFLKSDADIFLFIDGDIGFDWNNVFEMINIMLNSDDKKIICGAYPKKNINWDAIKKSSEKNFIKSAKDLIKYSSSFVVNFDGEDGESVFFNLDEPVQVLHSGTGFMMIHREVFEKFQKKYPEQMSIDPDTKEHLFYFFDCKIHPKTKHYLSEDYMFCEYAKDIGYKTWILPWVYLTHNGSYTYSGSFASAATLEYELYKD